MSIRRRRALLVVLPIVALLVAPGAALAAKSRTKVEPAQTSGVVKIRGTNGWRIQITGTTPGLHPGAQTVSVYGLGPEHAEVTYTRERAHFTKGGTIEAKLPGIGRIDLRYEPTEHHKIGISNAKGCTGARTAIGSNGVFRGTIDLHLAGGLTAVDAHSAHGGLWPSPKETCRVRHHSKAEIEREYLASGGSEEQLLDAVGKVDGGTVRFRATSFGGLPQRFVEFAAEYSRRERGMLFTASTQVQGKPGDFIVSRPGGSPNEATVNPPAPFTGSAEFELLLPTIASWTGDLRAPIPTLGTVELAQPTFRSSLCVGLTCTDTVPGQRISAIFALTGSD
jgi:hypothetical protein